MTESRVVRCVGGPLHNQNVKVLASEEYILVARKLDRKQLFTVPITQATPPDHRYRVREIRAWGGKKETVLQYQHQRAPRRPCTRPWTTDPLYCKLCRLFVGGDEQARRVLNDWLLDRGTEEGDKEAGHLMRLRRLDGERKPWLRYWPEKVGLFLFGRDFAGLTSSDYIDKLEEIGAQSIGEPRTYLWGAIYVRHHFHVNDHSQGTRGTYWYPWSATRFRHSPSAWHAIVVDRRDAAMLRL
jgi:hypothetical protein